MEPDSCKEMCANLTTQEETAEIISTRIEVEATEIALFLYDLTGVWLSESSVVTPLWFAARMFGGLVLRAVSRMVLPPADHIRQSTDDIDSLMVMKHSKTFDLDDLGAVQEELEGVDLAGKTGELCSGLCTIGEPLVLAVMVGSCGGSLLANSFIDETFLDNSPLVAYLQPSLICPVSHIHGV